MIVSKICKRFYLLLAIFTISMPTSALAASVTLKWKNNAESDISYYNIYYGAQSRAYGSPIPAGNVSTHTIDGLDHGRTYFFAITAVDTSGNESGYSSEASAKASSPTQSTGTLDVKSPINNLALTTNLESPQRWGRTVQIMAQAQGGTNQYEYQFVINGNVVRDYATSNSFAWNTIAFEGKNGIQVRVRNVGSTTKWQKRAKREFRIHRRDAPPSRVLLSTDVESPQVAGQAVVLTATAEGDTGDYEYCFFINGKLVRDYSPSRTYRWDTSDYRGKNNLKVWARNVLSDKKRQKVRKIKEFRVQ